MSTPVTVNGTIYPVPLYGETGWAQGSGNLSQLLIALAAATASTPSFMVTTAATVSPTTVVSGHTYMVASNSLAVTLNLPSPSVNAWFFVIDTGGNSLANNITIHRFGSENINGTAADLVLGANYGGWGFFSNGTNWFTLFGPSQGTLVKDDADGHIYRISTQNGVVISQLVA